MGRPELPEDRKRTIAVVVRMNVSEKLAIDNAAGLDGKNVSSWMREVLVEAAGGPKKSLSSMRVSPATIAAHLIKPKVQDPKPSEEGRKPDWWKQLEEDAKACQGRIKT